MSICWISNKTVEKIELTDDEVIAMYNELQEGNHALCEENAELREQLEQLKAANGKVVKALRRSSTAIRKSRVTIQELQKALEEDLPVDHTQYCRSCSFQCTEAKALLEQIDMYEGQGESPILDGFKMHMARMAGACKDRKKFQLKNTVDRYGNARGVCPQ
jgi:septal ring factor EnvC (AmiA/AmiB activator)